MIPTQKTGLIFDIKHYALHDGPGIRTTVFLKGCSLHCRWCHNPEGISTRPALIHFSSRCIRCGACVDQCPQKALSLQNHTLHRSSACDLCGVCESVCASQAWEMTGKQVTAQALLDIVKQDRLFYEESGGGVTFSGGEPLRQIDFLEECLHLCKAEGIHTAVDTSGSIPKEALFRAASLIDLVLFDIKTMNLQKHLDYTGHPNHRILVNLKDLSALPVQVIVRVPVIPGVNDQLRDIRSIGQFIKENTSVRRIDLLPYHRLADEKYRRLDTPYSLSLLPNLTPADIEPLRQSLLRLGFESITGG